MKITAKIIYRLTIALMIAGSVQTAAKEKISLHAPYEEWYVCFFYPNARPAQVTYVEQLDTDRIYLSLIHISEPMIRSYSSYAVSCLKKK
ncbi:hypothetical protein QMN62_25745, partial [Escherichia coli]|nr:hypothetical protein [Escherichia coli]